MQSGGCVVVTDSTASTRGVSEVDEKKKKEEAGLG